VDLEFVHAAAPLDFTIHIDTPAQLGADLIASAQAALLLSKPPLIVVDAGTATTVMMINADGQFIGGAIAPGMGISADALSQQASALTHVEWTLPSSVFGKNTVQAIQNGLLRGHAGCIEKLVTCMMQEKQTPHAQVWLTGGAMETLRPLLPKHYNYHPHLTLEGIMHIGQALRQSKGLSA
jgi:type III pantothenate kinase